MHRKTKEKLLRARKLYITALKGDIDKCHEIRIQIDNKEYVWIDLKEEFPKKIIYLNLSDGGFNYNLPFDDAIIIYGKSKILQVLNNSISSDEINQKTLSKVIELVGEMRMNHT